jgi:hypothetical protein
LLLLSSLLLLLSLLSSRPGITEVVTVLSAIRPAALSVKGRLLPSPASLLVKGRLLASSTAKGLLIHSHILVEPLIKGRLLPRKSLLIHILIPTLIKGRLLLLLRVKAAAARRIHAHILVKALAKGRLLLLLLLRVKAAARHLIHVHILVPTLVKGRLLLLRVKAAAARRTWLTRAVLKGLPKGRLLFLFPLLLLPVHEGRSLLRLCARRIVATPRRHKGDRVLTHPIRLHPLFLLKLRDAPAVGRA